MYIIIIIPKRNIHIHMESVYHKSVNLGWLFILLILWHHRLSNWFYLFLVFVIYINLFVVVGVVLSIDFVEGNNMKFIGFNSLGEVEFC